MYQSATKRAVQANSRGPDAARPGGLGPRAGPPVPSMSVLRPCPAEPCAESVVRTAFFAHEGAGQTARRAWRAVRAHSSWYFVRLYCGQRPPRHGFAPVISSHQTCHARESATARPTTEIDRSLE